MQRHFEYRDRDGVRRSAMQNYMGLNKAEANRQLSHLAAVSGWTDVEVFPPEMPAWKVKKRINDIENENGFPPRYSAEESTDPELLPKLVTITNADGTVAVGDVQATSPARMLGEDGLPAVPINESRG